MCTLYSVDICVLRYFMNAKIIINVLVILYEVILDFFPYYIFSLFQFYLNVQQSLQMVIFSTGVLLHVK